LSHLQNISSLEIPHAGFTAHNVGKNGRRRGAARPAGILKVSARRGRRIDFSRDGWFEMLHQPPVSLVGYAL
jgi:hypothetical protein